MTIVIIVAFVVTVVQLLYTYIIMGAWASKVVGASEVVVAVEAVGA